MRNYIRIMRTRASGNFLEKIYPFTHKMRINLRILRIMGEEKMAEKTC